MTIVVAIGRCTQHSHRMVFGLFSKRGRGPASRSPSLPTVKFDPRRVTEAICADLWDRINEFEDLPSSSQKIIYEAAVTAAERGRDLAQLTGALTRLGVPRARAAYIATYLMNRATALMGIAKSRELGLTDGQWLYSGAPCYSSNTPSDAELAMDAAHREAGGRSFPLDEGMYLNGAWTFPGLEPGCKCVTKPVVPGFD